MPCPRMFPFLLLAAVAATSCSTPALRPEIREADRRIEEGRRALEQGDVDTALAALDAARAALPESLEAHRLYGHALRLQAERLVESGTPAPIEDLLVKALAELDAAAADPTPPPRAAEDRARVLFLLGRDEEALGAFRAADSLEEPRSWVDYGDLALARAKALPEESVEENGAPEGDSPGSPGTKTGQETRPGEPRQQGFLEAIEAYGEAITREDSALARHKRATAHLWAGNPRKAEEDLAVALRLDPSSPETHDFLIQSYLNGGRARDAVAIYESAAKGLEGAPPADLALFEWYRGFAAYWAGEYDLAVASFGRALEGDPELLDAHYQRGKAFYAKGSFDEAADEFLVFFREAPDLFYRAMDSDGQAATIDGAIVFLADQRAQQGSRAATADARDLMHIAAERKANDPWLWNNYAFFCRETEQFEEAYEGYQRAVTLAPDEPRILNDCGLILYYHLGRDLDRAEELFGRAERIGRERLADPSLAEGDREELLVATNDAAENLGRLYYDRGLYEKALQEAQGVLEGEPDRFVSLQLRRDALRKLGRMSP